MLGLSIGLGIGTQQAVSGPTAPPATGTATMAQISTNDANRIYQRSTTTGGQYSAGTGTIPLTISSATAGTLNARISSGGATRGDLQPEWAAATIANAATTANIAGVAAGTWWGYLDIKDSTGTWQNGTTIIGMGALFGISGQSLTQRIIGRRDDTQTLASLSITPSTYTRSLASYQDGGADYIPTVATMPWLAFADVTDGTGPNSTGGAEFLNRMVTMLGVNCGIIGHCRGGQWLQAFVTSTGVSNADAVRLTATLARAGGAWEGFFWGQGHNNATSNCRDVAYQGALGILLGQIQATNSFSGCKYYVFGIPAVGGNGLGTNWAYNEINKGGAAWCAANGGTYVHMYDFKLADSYHPMQVGAITMGRHMYRATRTNYGQSSGLGPVPLSAIRTAAQQITVTVSDVGQSSLVLSGTPGNRIKVFPTGYVNNPSGVNDNCFPISSVTSPNKTTLIVNLANDPGDQNVLDLRFYFGVGPADPTLDNIYDNRTDGETGMTTGRILQANFTPIQVAAFNASGSAANAPPGGFVASPSQMNATGTGATYATGATGFGQELTGGFSVSNVVGESMADYTIEARFTCPATITSAWKLFKGSQFDFLQLGTDFKPANGMTFLKGPTALTPGHRYHIAYQNGPSGNSIYLTDITAAGASTRIATEAADTHNYWAGAARAYVVDSGSANATSSAIDEVAIWYGPKYSGTTYTMPTSPYVGTEAGLAYLCHLDSSLVDQVGR